MGSGSWRGGGCGLFFLAGVLVSATALFPQAQKDTGQSAPSQSDFEQLRDARELFEMHRLPEAKVICDRLVSKGGTIQSQAQELITKINTRNASVQDFQQAVELINRGDCQSALNLFNRIRQRDPDYAKDIGSAEARCKLSLSGLAPGPALDQGKELFNKRKFKKALEFFQSLRAQNPASQEVQDWIDRTNQQLAAEKQNATPQDAAKARAKADQERAAQEALLEDAIGEFYAGNLSHADQLLEQYLTQPGGDEAMAYFFRGTVACTEYFLAGAKDEQKEALARDLFAKARQADARFSPPADYISPRIMEIYQKSLAGS